MKVLWSFLIWVLGNNWKLWKMRKSVTVLTLSKMCLWNFSSAFIDNTSYYQADILPPRPLIPDSYAGEWCWAGATSTCSVLSHWTFSTPKPYTCLDFYDSAVTKYSTQCFHHLTHLDPNCSACKYRVHMGSSYWYVVVLKGECGGLGRCFQVLEDYSFLRRHPVLHCTDTW